MSIVIQGLLHFPWMVDLCLTRLVNLSSDDTRSRLRILSFQSKRSDAPWRLAELARKCGWDVKYDCIEEQLSTSTKVFFHDFNLLFRNWCVLRVWGPRWIMMPKKLAKDSGILGIRVLWTLFSKFFSTRQFSLIPLSTSSTLEHAGNMSLPCEIDKVALASKIAESTVIPSQLIQKLSNLNEAFIPCLQQNAHDFCFSFLRKN